MSEDLRSEAREIKIKIDSNSSGNDNQLLELSLKLLSRVPPNVHLFCDVDFQPAATFGLTLFSFSDSPTLEWLKQVLGKQLDRCPRCISAYTRGKASLIDEFSVKRQVPLSYVSQYHDVLNKWQLDRLVDKVPAGNPNAFLEVLLNPAMLRLNKALKAAFDQQFAQLWEQKSDLLNTELNAGVVYALFEGTSVEKEWARGVITGMQGRQYSLKEFTDDIMLEMKVHFLYIQIPSSLHENLVSHFWKGMIPVLSILSTEAIDYHFTKPRDKVSMAASIKHEIISIYGLLQRHLMTAFKERPTEYLLRALCMFVKKMGSDLWPRLHPFVFHNVLEAIFMNDVFLNKLVRLQVAPLPETRAQGLFNQGSLVDMIAWIEPMFTSLTPIHKQQFTKRVAVYFFNLMQQQQLSEFSKSSLFICAARLVVPCLETTITANELYSSTTIDSEIFSKVDSRAVMNDTYQIIVNTACGKVIQDEDSMEWARKIIKCVLKYDIMVLATSSFKLYNDKPVAAVDVSMNMWFALGNEVFTGKKLLAESVLSALANINGLVIYKNTSAHGYNNSAQKMLESTKQFILKLADLSPSDLKEVLRNHDASMGYWSCVFSADEQLYQATIDILYETFEVSGRLEGMTELLKNDLVSCMESINNVYDTLLLTKFFEPCPRAVRVLMDVISAISDPINGMFVQDESVFTKEVKNLIREFWSKTWKFLTFIYSETLKWAQVHPMEELVNFTKDTLDLSQAVVDSYKLFNELLGTGADTTTTLFQDVLSTFKDMLVWLRLSDEGLLSSCVNLIITTLNLAQELSLTFEKDIIEIIAKYGSKSQKFANKLTEQQSRDIMDKARDFDSDLVDKIVTEAETYRKQKEVALQQKLEEKQRLQEEKQRATEDRAAFLQKKAVSSSITSRPKSFQSTIMNFGKLSKDLPKVAAAPPKPMSALEKARLKLQADRVVHPAQTSVFHDRRPKKITAQNESDGSDDEGEGDIHALFHTAKRSGPELVDFDGKAMKTSKIDQKKLDEENMRRRLNVDLTPFYKSILKWNYSRIGDYPTDEENGYSAVKDSFKSVEEYQKVMEPLLLLETWQGLCSSRDRESYKPFYITIGSRTVVSDFYDVYASVDKKSIMDGEISEADLIVLAVMNKPNFNGDDVKQAQHTCLAKVREIKNQKGNNVDLTVRITRTGPFAQFLTPRANIVAMKVMQLTTVEREFGTLYGLPYFDLQQQIMKANPTEPIKIPEETITMVKKAYKVNDSQAKAIATTVATPGFSLIQGPPGTGKTKTILGIVGYFLSTVESRPSNVISLPTNGVSTLDQQMNKPKVLICAPSNAAVDELVLRLKQGVISKKGIAFTPNIVRLGKSDSINPAVKDVTLEELVDRQIASKFYDTNTPNVDFSAPLEATIKERNDVSMAMNDTSKSEHEIAALAAKKRELSEKIKDLGRKKDEQRLQNSINYRNRELAKKQAQTAVLVGADIICSTLSGAAHDVLAQLNVKFETVVVDEACQCTELSSIIPLRYGGKRCIMVGDPNQLPPTVLSGSAASFNYDQSLFVRMEKNCTPHLLDVQYRMNPLISAFPSKEFYKGRLHDGEGLSDSTHREWHSKFAPYQFYDIVRGRQEQNQRTFSYTNKEESNVAIELIENLHKQFPNVDLTGKIGIISPYKEQVRLLRNEFYRRFGKTISTEIAFNTIDGFQGQEKEIIIMSCVRAETGSVGFLKDFRRMNVALTRAKCSLWILGNHKALTSNPLWKRLVTDAAQRNLLQPACAGFLEKSNQRAQEIIGSVDLEKYKQEKHSKKRHRDEELPEKKSSGVVGVSQKQEAPAIPVPTSTSNTIQQHTKMSLKATAPQSRSMPTTGMGSIFIKKAKPLIKKSAKAPTIFGEDSKIEDPQPSRKKVRFNDDTSSIEPEVGREPLVPSAKKSAPPGKSLLKPTDYIPPKLAPLSFRDEDIDETAVDFVQRPSTPPLASGKGHSLPSTSRDDIVVPHPPPISTRPQPPPPPASAPSSELSDVIIPLPTRPGGSIRGKSPPPTARPHSSGMVIPNNRKSNQDGYREDRKNDNWNNKRRYDDRNRQYDQSGPQNDQNRYNRHHSNQRHNMNGYNTYQKKKHNSGRYDSGHGYQPRTERDNYIPQKHKKANGSGTIKPN